MPRSIPIYLDRLYHIRYPLSAIWDAEHIVPGGFFSLWERDWEKRGFETVRFLFWLGLQHEEKVTLPEVGTLLNNSISTNKIELVEAYLACSDALYLAGWFVKSNKLTKAEPKTLKEHIIDIEQIATRFLDISLKEMWDMTPTEINELLDSAIIKYEISTGIKKINPPVRKQNDEDIKNVLRNAFG